jgi:hypothetical protein
MVEISEDLKEIVSSTLTSISEGLKGNNCKIAGVIEFDIAVVKTGGMKGKLKFILAEASARYEKERISRIKFMVLGNNAKQFRNFMWIPKENPLKNL